ncbi:MAG: hypothetical protein GDA50_00205 [Alphaproteobacteria bacterium GM202ARS2]|nr:hypothetical protein [Alphaproteobacteria bacterium GM202ARS2]
MPISSNMSTVLLALRISHKERDVRFQQTQLVRNTGNTSASAHVSRGNWQTVPESRKTLHDHFMAHVTHQATHAIEHNNGHIPRKVVKRYRTLLRDIEAVNHPRLRNKPLKGRAIRKLATRLVDVTSQVTYFNGKGRDAAGATGAGLDRGSVLYDAVVHDSKGQLTPVRTPLLHRAFKRIALRFQSGREHYARRAAAQFARSLINRYGQSAALSAFEKQGLAIQTYLAELGTRNPSVRLLSTDDVQAIESHIAKPYQDSKRLSQQTDQLAKEYALDGDKGKMIFSQLASVEQGALYNRNRRQLFSIRFRTMLEVAIGDKAEPISKQEVEKIALETWQALAATTDEDAARLAKNDEDRNNALWQHQQLLAYGQINESLAHLATFNTLVSQLLKEDPIVGIKNVRNVSASHVSVLADVARRPLRSLDATQAEKTALELAGNAMKGWGIAVGILYADAGNALVPHSSRPSSLFFPYPAEHSYDDLHNEHDKQQFLQAQDDYWEPKSRLVMQNELSFYRLTDDMRVAGSDTARRNGESMNTAFRNAMEAGRRLRENIAGDIQQSDSPHNAITELARQASHYSGLSATQQREIMDTIARGVDAADEKTS